MAVSDILPWRRDGEKTAIRRRDEDPIVTLQHEMNRMFDEFFTKPFSIEPYSAFAETANRFMPRVDVSESEKEISITAELPGMDEKDIQVSIENQVLSISGSKESKTDEKERQYHRIERSYGAFRREIGLPSDVDESKVDATFKKGVLNITLQKTGKETTRSRRIPIKTE